MLDLRDADQQVSELARTTMSRSAIQYHDDLIRGCKGNPNFKALPMHFFDPVYVSFDGDFRTFFGPAIILS